MAEMPGLDPDRYYTLLELRDELGWAPSGDVADAAAYAFSGLIGRRAENERLSALGVDPGRVIDGEAVQKEIEG